MGSDKDPDLKVQDPERPAPLPGYPAQGKDPLEPRITGTKLSRHNTRILPTPIVLRGEYNKLVRNPKFGRRSAVGVLARKYRVSQSAVIKTLKKKGNQE